MPKGEEYFKYSKKSEELKKASDPIQANPKGSIVDEIYNESDIPNVTNTLGSLDKDIFSYNKDSFNKYNKYDVILSPALDWEEQRAQNQGSWERIHRGSKRFGSELVFGTLDAISSIPDVFQNATALANGEMANHENVLASFFKEINDSVRKDNPIYREQSSSGFSPAHLSWWMDNVDSLASAATFIIPTTVIGKATGSVAKGLGSLGKLGKAQKAFGWMDDMARSLGVDSKIAKIASKGLDSKTTDFIGALGGSIYANASESFEEAVPITKETYDKALKAGKSPEEAKQIAAKVGRDIYIGNLANIALELPSTMFLLKSFKGTRNILNPKVASARSIRNLDESIIANASKSGLAKYSNLAIEMSTEGLQETINYISSEEAKHTANLAIKGEEDATTFKSRLIDDYLNSSDMWTSAFFGALGGVGFIGAGALKKRFDHKFSKDDISTSRQEKRLKELQPIRLQELASIRNDETLFNKAKSDISFEKGYNHAESGTMGKFIDELNSVKNISDEEAKSLGIDKNEIPKIIEQVERAEKAYEDSVSKIGLRIPEMNSGVDINRNLSKAIYDRESNRDEIRRVVEEIDKSRVRLKDSLESVNKDFTDEMVELKTINSSIESLKKEKDYLSLRYNKLQNRSNRGSNKINKELVKNALLSITSQLNSLSSTRDNLTSLIEEQKKENKRLSLDKLKLEEHEQSEKLLKLNNDLSSLYMADRLHTIAVNNLSTEKGINNYVKSVDQDIKDDSNKFKNKVDSTTDSEELKSLEGQSNSIEDEEYLNNKIEDIDSVKKQVEDSNTSLNNEGNLVEDDIDPDFNPDIDIDQDLIDSLLDDDVIDLAPDQDIDQSELEYALYKDNEKEKVDNFEFDLTKTVEIIGEDGTKYNKFDKNKDNSWELIDVNNNIRSSIPENKIASDNKPSHNTFDVTKENLPSVDIFNTLMIRNKFGDVELLQKTLQKSDWKSKIRFVADKRFASKNEFSKGLKVKDRLYPTVTEDKKGIKTIKPQTLFNNNKDLGKKIYASSSLDIDIKLQILKEGKWVDGADIANPDQYVYADSIEETASPVEFDKITLNEFKDNFTIQNEIPTEAQFEQVKSSHKKLKDFHSLVKTLYEKSKDNQIDITNNINSNIYGIGFKKSVVGREISLDTFTPANLGSATSPKYEIIDNRHRKYISNTINKELPTRKLDSRYTANVLLPNGVSVNVPIRPKVLSNKNQKKLVEDINRISRDLNKVVEYNEYTIKNSEDLVNTLNIYIPPVNGIHINILPKYSKKTKKFFLTLDIGSDSIKNTIIPIPDLSNIDNLISLINSQSIENVIITKNNIKNSISESETNVDPSLFEVLSDPEVFNKYSLRVDFNNETLNKPFYSNSKEDIKREIEPSLKDVHKSIEVDEDIEISEEDLESLDTILETSNTINTSDFSNLTADQLEDLIIETQLELAEDPDNKDLTNKLNSLEKTYHDLDGDGSMGITKKTTDRNGSGIVDLEQANSWLKDKMPPHIDSRLFDNTIKNLIDTDTTWGYFHNNTIYLNERAEEGTQYHEAFHAVFRTSLDDTNIDNAINIARKERGVPTDSEIRDLKNSDPSYKELTSIEATQILYEEYLADKFSDFVRNKKTIDSKSILYKLFQKIKNFIDWLTNKRTDIDILFSNINRGAFSNSSIVNNRFTAKKNPPVFKLIPKTSTDKSESIVNTVAAKIISLAKVEGNTRNFGDKGILNESIDSILDESIKLYTPSKYPDRMKEALREQLIYKNPKSRQIIKEEVYKLLKLYSFNPIEDSINSLDESETSERSWDISITEVGGFDAVNKEIKQFIALTNISSTDQFGNIIEKAIDFPQVYALLERSLSSKTVEQQKEILKILSKDNKQVAAVYSKLKSEAPSLIDINTSDTLNQRSLLNRFFSSFEKEKINYIQVLKEEKNGNFEVFSANQKDIKQIRVNIWSNLFNETISDRLLDRKFRVSILNSLDKVIETLSSVEDRLNIKTSEELIGDVKNSFIKLGIDLSDGYVRHSLGLNEESTSLDSIPKLEKEDVLALSDTISKKSNPFIDTKAESSRGRLLKIADSDSKFREDLFDTNFQDANNKTRYTYILPSHLLIRHREVVNDLSTDSKIESLKSDEYYKYNWLFQDDLNNISNLFKSTDIAFTGDIREIETRDSEARESGSFKSKEGTTFKSIDPKSMLLNLHGLYSKEIEETTVIDSKSVKTGRVLSYYTPMVLESKSTSISVLLPKNKELYSNGEITKDTIDSIYNTIFVQEYKRLKGDFGTKFKNNKFVNLQFLDNSSVYEKLNITFKDNKIDNIPTSISNEEDIKNLIKVGLENEIQLHIDTLIDYDIIKRDSSGYLGNILLDKKSLKGSDIKEYVSNFVLNDFLNTTAYNQLVQGDLAKAKNSVDRVKRNGGEIGSGPSLGEGTYNVAYYTGESQYIKDGDLVSKDTEGSIEVDADDAQVYMTLKRKNFIQSRYGRLTESQQNLYDKLEEGIPLTYKEYKDSGIDLISDKGVYYDGTYYHKMSSIALTKELTSYTTDKGKTWLPLPGKEKLHNMREFMEKNSIDELVPLSASKLASDKVINDNDFHTGKILTKYSEDKYPSSTRENRFWRKQVETHSGKQEIVHGTQFIQLIDTELPDNEYYNTLKKEYYNTLAQTRSNSMERALNLLNEVKQGKRSIPQFISKLKDSVESSGGDAQLSEFLEEVDGDFKYDMNLPHVLAKFEQLFLAHFKTGVLSQKIKGYKSVLVSSAGYNVLRDVNNNKIINSESFKRDPKTYTGKDYSPSRLRIHRKTEEGISYAEVAMTRRQASLIGLDINDTTNKKQLDSLLTMIGIRIPTQTHHSMMPFKVVEFLPEYYGDVVIAPSEITYLSGADYDVDSLYSHRKDYYTDSENNIKIYGEATTDEELWQEYYNYEINNNKDLKKYVKSKQLNSERYQNLLLGNTDNEVLGISDEDIITYLFTGGKNPFKDPINKIKAELNNEWIKEGLQLQKLISTFEEFKSSSNKTNNGALNNKLLEIGLNILTDPNISESLFTPATMSGLEEDSKLIFNGLRGEKEGTSILGGVNGKFDAWKNNSVGKANVGNAANANLISAFLTKMKVKLRDGSGFTIDDITFDDYSVDNELDISINPKTFQIINKESKRRKADTLSTVVSAMTDNAKERLAAKLNLTTSNLSEFSNMIALGIGRTRTMLFANQPSILELTKKIDKINTAIDPSTEKSFTLIEESIKKYNKITIFLGNILSKDSSKYADYLESIGDIKSEDLIKSILYKPNHEIFEGKSTSDFNINKEDLIEDFKHSIRQQSILLLYKKVVESTKYFTNVGQILKINKGIGTSFTESDKILEAIKSLDLDREESSTENPFLNIKEAVDNNINIKENISNLNKIYEISKNYFLNKTPFYSNLTSRLKSSLLSSISSTKINDLQNDLTSYLSIKILESKSGKKYSDYNYLLYPQLGKDTLVSQYNTLLKNESFNDNPFIKYLSPILSEDSVKNMDTLEGNMRLKSSPKTVERFINGFEELYNTPEYNEFAKNMVRYLIVKDGLQFKNDSFIKYISPRIFQDLASELKKLNYKLANNDESIFEDINLTKSTIIEEFIELYSRHPSNINNLRILNKDLFKLETPNKTVDVFKFKKGEGFLDIYSNTQSKKLHDLLNIFNTISSEGYVTSIEYPDFFRTIDKKGNTTIYKKVGNISNLVEITGLQKDLSTHTVGAKYITVNTIGSTFQSPYANNINTLEYLDTIRKDKVSKKSEESLLSSSNLEIDNKSNSLKKGINNIEKSSFVENIDFIEDLDIDPKIDSESYLDIDIDSIDLDEIDNLKNNRLENPDC